MSQNIDLPRGNESIPLTQEPIKRHILNLLYARPMIAAKKMFEENPTNQMAKKLRSLLKPTVACLLTCSFTVVDAAEDTIRGTTASTQPHPELVADGIRGDNFIFYPGIAYSLTFNDNVFATENNKESSFVSELIPSLSANSDWNRHALTFTASAVSSWNHEFSSEDYSDWSIDADGIIEISRDTKWSLGAGIGIDHLPRSAPDDSRGVEPTQFDHASLYTRISHRSGRMVNAVNYSLRDKEYQDVEAIRLGVPVTIDNSDRDRLESRLRWRIGYRYIADQQLFFTLEANRRDYDRTRIFSGRDQSSTGLETTVGLNFDYHGIMLGEIALGYRSQDYENPLEDIDTPLLEASVRWNLTDLTTVNFILDHQVQESIDLIFSGYTLTTASIGLDHELRRNLVLNLSLEYSRADYVGIDPAERVDDTYNLVTEATYRMNRNIFFNARFAYAERKGDLKFANADSSRFDFSQNLISFELQAQF